MRLYTDRKNYGSHCLDRHHNGDLLGHGACHCGNKTRNGPFSGPQTPTASKTDGQVTTGGGDCCGWRPVGQFPPYDWAQSALDRGSAIEGVEPGYRLANLAKGLTLQPPPVRRPATSSFPSTRKNQSVGIRTVRYDLDRVSLPRWIRSFRPVQIPDCRQIPWQGQSVPNLVRRRSPGNTD